MQCEGLLRISFQNDKILSQKCEPLYILMFLSRSVFMPLKEYFFLIAHNCSLNIFTYMENKFYLIPSQNASSEVGKGVGATYYHISSGSDRRFEISAIRINLGELTPVFFFISVLVPICLFFCCC